MLSAFQKFQIAVDKNCEGADIDISYIDGTMQHKHVPLLSLCRLLSSYGSTLNEPLGEMPNGYINARYSSNNTFSVVLKSPALHCPVQFMHQLYDDIPYPDLLFILEYKSGFLCSSSVWGMNKAGSICRYPFGNVHENGPICWGGYRHQEIFSMKDSEKTIWKFYELPTNNDLWERSYVNADVGVLSNMYSMINGKQEFPDEWLVPVSLSLDGILGGL